MPQLRSTVIMKTDLAEFTTKVKGLTESDLSDLLNLHKNLISQVISNNEGSIVKGEGDSFWIAFPSVTIAALAAIEIQQELRISQTGLGDKKRLAIRVAITLGDVLHQEGDIFGNSVNLAARIESITPPDEIYLSQAAWLALNKAEVGNSYVNEFSLKGIEGQEKIYKIDQKHKTRIIKNQIIVFTDIRNFQSFYTRNSIEGVENLLTELEKIIKVSCEVLGGTVRQFIGDCCFLTFPEADAALNGIGKLCKNWADYINKNKLSCPISISINKGDLFIYRAFIYGLDVNLAAGLESLSRYIERGDIENSVIVSNTVWEEIKEPTLKQKLQLIEPENVIKKIKKESLRKFVENNNVYELQTKR